jgi:2-polyprenyl-3-methyl-5-hydroxy-6-metoxy-1,4-benzoquinol methylase
MIDTEARAKLSEGSSDQAIYEMVLAQLRAELKSELRIAQKFGTLVDVGCGQGNLFPYMQTLCDRYIGVDVIKYVGFPENHEFRSVNLDSGKIDLPDSCAEVVCSVETIEHLENPRAFVRELVRLAKPNGLVIITTPNQLSFLSKLTLVLKNEFNAFQASPGLYPSHITALLEIDLTRIFAECGLSNIQISYSNQGRIPFTSKNWHRVFQGKSFSDNLLCMGCKVSLEV